MKFPSSFDVQDFRWIERRTSVGPRLLEYTGFRTPIRIPMFCLDGDDEGYAAGVINPPDFSPAELDAFMRCGGFEGLRNAAKWFANSR